MQALDRSDWRWHGMAGHFCCSDQCCFRLHTVVGEYRVSTVGCYHPISDQTGKPHTLKGSDSSLYETMVFAVADDGPMIELDTDAYMTETEAEDGHLRMCLVWQERQNLARQVWMTV